MELLLNRDTKGLSCTFGSFFIDNEFYCYTLEDVVRQVYGHPVSEWKIAKQTAIPTGRYEVVITYSERFKRDMPLLLDVAGFGGIRIHTGNTDADTEGCILLGLTKDESGEDLLLSRAAFDPFFERLKATLGKGEKVFITVA